MRRPIVGLVLVVLFAFTGSKVFAAPSIGSISDAGSTPKFEKFEITFQVTGSVATNLQMPYDSAPPPGINQQGISVNAVFTSPSGKSFSYPAFYYSDYTYTPNIGGSGKDWMYPTGTYSWKVRFAPDEVGTWSYYLSAQDASGTVTTQSSPRTFSVVNSASHGFVKVSSRDSRYFEYSDGTYFPALGWNANYQVINHENPTSGNQTMVKLGQNGVQVIREWLDGWAIWGSTWNPWYSSRNDYDGYLPRPGLITLGALSTPATPSSEMTLVYAENSPTQQNTYYFDACRALFPFQPLPAIKPNTKYHIKVSYEAIGLTGPRTADTANFPNNDNFGFVVKLQNADGNWHGSGDPNGNYCWNYSNTSATGIRVTPYGKDTVWTPNGAGGNNSVWTDLDGEWTSGSNQNFLPIMYLTLENANNMTGTTTGGITYNWHPYVYIRQVSVAEDKGGGVFGPNIIQAYSMEHLNYFKDRNSFALDKLLDLAHQNNTYFKFVLMDKNEQLENEIGYDGKKFNWTGGDNNNFFGNYRAMTAVRWLQQAWERYLQARWGYSTNIHSFEVTNEAAAGGWTNHYAQTDEMGRYLHCGVFGIDVTQPHTDGFKCTSVNPDAHLVSTSFVYGWESGLWSSPKYPNVDFADIHHYIAKDTEPTHYYDTAKSTADESLAYGAKVSGSNKPVIRGETGLITSASNTDAHSTEITPDTSGVWLHNFVWGGINPGGLTEHWWYTGADIYQGYTNAVDGLLPQFKYYYQFIKDIPLSNGNYTDASASTVASLRAWGQKDLINKRAHLWIANVNHTWQNVVNNVAITPVTATVTVTGFTPNTSYKIEWWNTYTGQIASSNSQTSNSNGDLVLSVANLTTDTAVKIGDYSATPATIPQLLQNWFTSVFDQNADGIVNSLDFGMRYQ